MMAAHNDSACRVLVGLLEARTGQTLAPNRIWRIETALKPIMRHRKIDTLDQLVGKLLGAEDRLLVDEVVDALLNNESYFFRDNKVFEELNTNVFKAVRERNCATKTMSIWLAGCSTGQEAYSIAMMIADEPQKWRGWNIRLVATDISHNAIERAEQGVFTQFEVQRGLSVTRMVRWFNQHGTNWKIKDEIRDRVKFQQHSLLSQAPPAGPFDVILCRNVLLYFSGEVRREVFSRLRSCIADEGVLMLGAGETVLGQTEDFVSSQEHRGFYTRAPRIAKLDRRLSATG